MACGGKCYNQTYIVDSITSVKLVSAQAGCPEPTQLQMLAAFLIEATKDLPGQQQIDCDPKDCTCVALKGEDGPAAPEESMPWERTKTYECTVPEIPHCKYKIEGTFWTKALLEPGICVDKKLMGMVPFSPGDVVVALAAALRDGERPTAGKKHHR